MKLSLKIVGLNNNLKLKIFALIFGYFFWLILVQNQKINTIANVPLCFYGIKDNLEVIAPENVKLTLCGKRLELAKMDLNQAAAIHVDASPYDSIGNYKIKLNETDIFLQNKIKLIDYFPSEVSIEIKEKK